MHRILPSTLLVLLVGCSSPTPTSVDAAGDVQPDVARDHAMPVDVAEDRAALADAAVDRGMSTDVTSDAIDDRPSVPDVAVDAPTTVTDTPMVMPDAPQVSDVVVADASGADVPADGPLVPDGVVVPDFMLPDLNMGSRTHRMTVSPRIHLGRISVWYFSSAT